MNVELLVMKQAGAITGIGRYIHIIQSQLPSSIKLHIVSPKFIPFAKRFTFLQSVPLGIQQHIPGSIVHIPQIMGCCMILWKPYRPVVATVHDLGPLVLAEESGLHDPIARLIFKLSLSGLKRVNLILAQSEFTRQTIIQKLGIHEDRVITNYTAIDHQLFRPYSNARQRLIELYPLLSGLNGQWLLYVGSEIPRKNLSILLISLAKLREQYPNLYLLKVGSAGGQVYRNATLHNIEILGIQDNVHFFEGVPDNHLPLFYSAADLLVHPSMLEGFGLPALEAMACGTPVVCSDAASLPEITGGAACLLPADDSQAWVSTIDELLQDLPQRQTMTGKGLARAGEFSWHKTAQGVAHVYRSL